MKKKKVCFAKVKPRSLDRRQIIAVTFIFFFNLTLYAPCIILQYVYKPTRCTKFL